MERQIRKLLEACEEGDVSTVNALFDSGLDVNSCDFDDTTALQVAASNGHEHLVRLLIMRGATLDLANSMGWTPLLLASRHGHDNVVSLLLQNQADINAETKLGASALTLAARGGYLKICKMLIENGIDLSPSTGIGTAACEFTSLMVAAHQGHDTIVRYLIDHRFDVNYRTPSMGMNALMMAALSGHMATSQVLLERGADPNLTNVNSCTPFQVATISKKRELKGYLERKTTNKPKIEREEFKPDIVEAARKADLTRMREILDLDLTQRDVPSPDGATPLMYAAMQGRLDIAQLLVEKGCDIDKQDAVSGWTALMQAVYHAKKAVAKYLINAGANVLIPAKNGFTAFDMTTFIGETDTELYRMMAAKAVHVAKPNSALERRASLSALKQAPDGSDEQPKNGIKAWWNRMSRRFRNLKLGGTMRSSNKLAPALGLTEGDGASCNGIEGEGQEPTENHLPPQLSEELPTQSKKRVAGDALGSTNASSVSTIEMYESMVKETRKSASMFTLNGTGPNQSLAATVGATPSSSASTTVPIGGLVGSSTASEQTLAAVIPPFLPPPTFEKDRPKMPPISSRRSMTSLSGGTTFSNARTIMPPTKLLKNYTGSASTQNLINVASAANPSSTPSPTNINKFHGNPVSKPTNDTSPSSSGGASQLTSNSNKSQDSKGRSSASSSTLTAGSGSRYIQVNPPDLFKPTSPAPSVKPPSFITAHHQQFKRTGPSVVRSSHMLDSSALSSVSSSHTKQSSTKSNSSKETNSTLTPAKTRNSKGTVTTSKSSMSTSQPTSTSVTDSQPTLSTQADDIGSLLKKLSLESYKPIFEEQEVDMEAFLSLTDEDLKEIGVSQQEPRKQILTAITELNSGKGREKQHLQDTLASFTTDFSTKGSSAENLGQWALNAKRSSTPKTKS